MLINKKENKLNDLFTYDRIKYNYFSLWNQIGCLYIAEIIKLGVYTGLHDRRIKPLDF